ncbi:MAG: S8 family serine peptidase [Candidatus Melainabacteria bacterium]
MGRCMDGYRVCFGLTAGVSARPAGLPGNGDPQPLPVTFIEFQPYPGDQRHARLVRQVFEHYAGDTPSRPRLRTIRDDPRDIRSPQAFVAHLGTHGLRLMRRELEDLMTQADAPRQVVNASLSFSRVDIYRALQERLRHAPDWALQVGGATPQAVVRYVNQTLSDSPDFAETLASYQRATQRAGESGMVIVVAAGNANAADPDFGFPGAAPGDGFNFLAMSDDVIAVAASELNDEHWHDDSIAPFSSRGDGRYNPTLTAPGRGVLIVGENTHHQGTSYAAPIVSATVVQMLHKNPARTPAEIRGILQNTAHNRPDREPGFGPEHEGAGILNRQAALSLAGQATGNRLDLVA